MVTSFSYPHKIEDTLTGEAYHFEIVSVGLKSRNGHSFEGVLKLLEPINTFIRTEFKPSDEMVKEFYGTDRWCHISFGLLEDGTMEDIRSGSSLGGEFDNELISFLQTWIPPEDWLFFSVMVDDYWTEIRAVKN